MLFGRLLIEDDHFICQKTNPERMLSPFTEIQTENMTKNKMTKYSIGHTEQPRLLGLRVFVK